MFVTMRKVKKKGGKKGLMGQQERRTRGAEMRDGKWIAVP